MTLLITGAKGQIGSELVSHLRSKYPSARLVTTRLPGEGLDQLVSDEVVVALDVTDKKGVEKLVATEHPAVIYHLAGILSVSGEKDPMLAWKTNVESLKNILDASVSQRIPKLFWPSSIAAFGQTTPRENTPQLTVMEPNTMYGVTKVAGELLCQYYTKKYGLDIRSVRFPGLISYKTVPGGGTTDYAVDMFYQAILKNGYTCFVSADTVLPMMYMDDAIHAMDLLMAVPPEKLTIHTSYNLTALHFSAAELAAEIKRRIPKFICDYQPDIRQQIADSWPQTIDDSQARQDWSWHPKFDLGKMVDDMLLHLREKLKPATDRGAA